MQRSEGQGLGGRDGNLTQGDPLRHGAEGGGGSLLLAALPEGLKGLVLTGEQPPLTSLNRDHGNGSLLGSRGLGHQPGQAKRLTRLAWQPSTLRLTGARSWGHGGDRGWSAHEGSVGQGGGWRRRQGR